MSTECQEKSSSYMVSLFFHHFNNHLFLTQNSIIFKEIVHSDLQYFKSI